MNKNWVEVTNLGQKNPDRIKFVPRDLQEIINENEDLKEHFIKQEEEKEEFYKKNKIINPSKIGAYLSALKSRWGSSVPFVSEEEANRRASICESCPHKISVGNCLSCSKISSMLMQTPKKINKDIKGCEICGCYLQQKVWLSENVIQSDERVFDWPNHCWAKNIYENKKA
jgi:hypothetical protein